MNKSELLYLNLPSWLQSILVGGYGYKQYLRRYSGNYNDILGLVKRSGNWSKSQTEDYQAKNLNSIMIYSAKNIPYYIKLFSDHGIQPSQIQNPSDLESIPILEKETLRTKAHEFLPINTKRTYTVHKTSGSSGTPVTLHIDELTYKMAMALLVDFEEANGVKFKEKRATFSGRVLKFPGNMKPPFWKFNHSENQMLYSSYHMNVESIKHYVNSLNKFRPSEIIGYPSAISELADLIYRTASALHFRPKLIVTNSENLLDWQREKIATVFECKVKDYYSTAEYLNFAGEDLEGMYKSSPLPGITELEPKGGSEGNLIMTTLTNQAMPLIRYRVGDNATIKINEREPYGCPSFITIDGRIDEYLKTTDGRNVGRISQIFKGVKGLKEAQVMQKLPGSAEFRLVSDGINRLDEDVLLANVRLRLDKDFKVTFKYLDHIPKEKNGKFRLVVKK